MVLKRNKEARNARRTYHALPDKWKAMVASAFKTANLVTALLMFLAFMVAGFHGWIFEEIPKEFATFSGEVDSMSTGRRRDMTHIRLENIGGRFHTIGGYRLSKMKKVLSRGDRIIIETPESDRESNKRLICSLRKGERVVVRKKDVLDNLYYDAKVVGKQMALISSGGAAVVLVVLMVKGVTACMRRRQA